MKQITLFKTVGNVVPGYSRDSTRPGTASSGRVWLPQAKSLWKPQLPARAA